jgi:superfamily II DNA or RNA helicase
MNKGYINRISPDHWVMPHKTNHKEFIKETFKYKKTSKADGMCALFSYQKFIKDYVQYKSPYRGVLLYYGLGTGKTRASIAAAEALSDNLEIVVLLPASLQKNYITELLSCGNPAFRTDRKWKFVQSDAPKFKSYKQAALQLGMDSDAIRKADGVWIIKSDDASDSNWDSLDDKQRTQIQRQILGMIKKRYTFINYDGQRQHHIRELGREYFHNKVVIIDEVHNFISSVVNKSKIKGNLYKMLMEAKNCKIIALSGTPLLNRPIEMAYLINLIRGPLDVYELKLNTKKQVASEAIVQFLQANKHIDTFKYSPGKRLIEVSLLPVGFTNAENGTVQRSDNEAFTPEVVLASLQKELEEKFNASFSHVKTTYQLMPTDTNTFNKLFMTESGKVKNERLLERRLNGLISYYKNYDPDQYPIVGDVKDETTLDHVDRINVVTLTMPQEMYNKYSEIREVELDEEEEKLNKKSKRGNHNDDDDDDKGKEPSGTYKILSRCACLFCFPPEIDRPYPKNIRRMLEEVDYEGHEEVGDGDADVNDVKGEDDEKVKDYESAKKNVLAKLGRGAKKYLSDDNLAKYGPKYLKIVQKLKNSPGPALIYSQFRGLEGLGVMQKVLGVRGYALMDCKKAQSTGAYELVLPTNLNQDFYIVFSDDKEKNKVLLDVFNSAIDKLTPKIKAQVEEIAKAKNIDIEKEGNLHGLIAKVILITKSGSEGISLKNVRQVHIMEPYWNDIRIQQVLGRAVRAGSHLALPKTERQVDVFMYIMTFSKEHKKLTTRDGSLTTDEQLKALADRKSETIRSLQRVMKNAAVDCEFNSAIHKDTTCMKIPVGFGELLYQYQPADKDEKDDVLTQRAKVVKESLKYNTISKKDGTTYGYLENGDLFDLNEYKSSGRLHVIGSITFDKNNKPKVTIR